MKTGSQAADLFACSDYDLHSIRQHIESSNAKAVTDYLVESMRVEARDIPHLCETLQLRLAFDQGAFAAKFSSLVDKGMSFASKKPHYYKVHSALYGALNKQQLQYLSSLPAPHPQQEDRLAPPASATTPIHAPAPTASTSEDELYFEYE